MTYSQPSSHISSDVERTRGHVRKTKLHRTLLLGLVLAALLLSSCSKSQSVGYARSPDGRMEVEVFYKTVRGNPAHDGQISITLARNGAKKTIYSDDEDRNPFFVDIGWSADSRVVSVWELDGLTREIFWGYDVRENRQINENVTIEKVVRESLTKRFNLWEKRRDARFDPVRWTREAVTDNEIPVLWPGIAH